MADQYSFCKFYGLSKVICDISRFHEIFEKLQLDEIVEVINHIDWMVDGPERKLYVSMAQEILRESIEMYCYDVPADTYDGSRTKVIPLYQVEQMPYMIPADPSRPQQTADIHLLSR